MPSSQDIANDAAATFAAYPELVTKIDDGTTVPDGQPDRWIGASYANFVDGCLEQINEVFVGSRAISGPLRVAGAPASGWNANADDVVIGDASAGHGMSIYQQTTGQGTISFRTTRSFSESVILYDGTSRFLLLGAGRDVNTNGNVTLTNTVAGADFSPFSSSQIIDLGLSSKPWRDLNLSRHAYIDEETAPATPSSGAVLYVDSADGALKVKFSTGTVVTLGTP